MNSDSLVVIGVDTGVMYLPYWSRVRAAALQAEIFYF